MSHFLYYPPQNCSLSDLSSELYGNTSDLDSYKQLLLTANSTIANPDSIQLAHKPIILPSTSSSCIHLPQCTAQEHRRLGHMANTLGGFRVSAIADLLAQTKILDNIGDTGTFLSGVSAGTVKTAGHVLKAIEDYDKAVQTYDNFKEHGGAKLTLNKLKRERSKSFVKMNYVLEQKGLNVLYKHAYKTQQGFDIRGRVVSRAIPVSNNIEVQNLKRFAKHARYAGKGLIFLDAGLRVNSAYQKYLSGEDWAREAIVQTTGFTAGLTTATMVIGLIAVATPLGLVLAITLSGAAAFGVDWGVKEIAGLAYDNVAK